MLFKFMLNSGSGQASGQTVDTHLTGGGRWLHGCFWDDCLQARQLTPPIGHSYEALDGGRFGGHPDHLDNRNGNSHRS